MNEYQQGFRNGWAAALGKMTEEVKWLEKQNFGTDKPRGVANEVLKQAPFKNACEKISQELGQTMKGACEKTDASYDHASYEPYKDPWNHIASLRSAMQMLGKRLDETQAGIQEHIVALEGSMSVRSKDISQLASAMVRTRTDILTLGKENTNMRVDLQGLTVRVYNTEKTLTELEKSVGLEKNLLRGLDSDNSKHTSRIDELASVFDAYRADVDKQTNDALGDMEQKLQDLNIRLSRLDQRTIGSLQIGGVSDPLPIGDNFGGRNNPNGF